MNRFRIYWWAKTEAPRKYGYDDVELAQDELTKDEADELLSAVANCEHGSDVIELPNFDRYYPLATQCINFGVREVQKLSVVGKK